jgi:hypothetical protein
MLDVAADNFAVTGNSPFLSIDDGSSFQTVKVEMHALGTISGHAFDEKGEPLVDARVQALAFRAESIGQVLTPIAFADTNDLGEYRIASLESDDYYIRITPPGNRILTDSYPVTYYPNTTDAAMAAKIVVGGSEVTGIDAKLATRGVKVRGKVIQADGKNTQLIVLLMPRSLSVMVGAILGPNTADQTSDEFELRGVAPGSYYLYAITRGNPPNGLEWVRFPLEVADKDIDDFNAAILPAGTIKGRIIVAEDATDAEKLDLSSVSLSAGPAELPPFSGWAPASARIDKNGDFVFHHVSETKLFLRDQILNDNWFISSVRFNGSDALTNGFSGQPGKEGVLEIVLSNASGSLAGIVKNKQEKPVPAGRIALLPEPALRGNPFLVRTTVAIEEGKFTMETIPPGDYTAIAFPDEDKFTPAFLRDLPSVEKYERFGQHVTIEAKETKHLDLTVAPSEP